MKASTTFPLIAGFLVASSSLALFPGTAKAVDLLNGFGGPKGFGTNSVFRNDDDGVGPIANPFPLNLYGTTYNSFFVNTNGNITFQSVLEEYTPTFFPGAPQPIIAPYWADVDTRNPTSGDEGLVWYTSPDAGTTVVTWNNVGVYNQLNPPTNNFQLVLRNLASTGNTGDFSFEFRYNNLKWTTGQASGGDDQGLGGTPALAGYDSGNGSNYFTIPGSKTAAVLDLVNTTNVNEAGVWRFGVRNGSVEIPSVPGPLPIFGIAATFAWSRRLRKRISTSS